MSKGRTNCVFSWGLGKGGALGQGDEEDRDRPSLVLALNGFKIYSLVASGAHTFAISDQGLYSWGLGSAGQLGTGELLDQVIPRSLTIHHKIVQISAGVDHTLARTDTGEVYSWGSGSGGKLGHGNFEWYAAPRRIEALKDKHVSSVAAGTDHSVLCTREGEVYSWGAGLFGALGHGNSEHLAAPKLITPFSPSWSVVKSVGAGNSYSIALTGDGKIYTWGSGVSGVLGHKNEQNYDVPKVVDALNETVIAQISAGRGHVLALAESGEVYSWGNGEEGQLGHGNAWNQLAPKEIAAFKALKEKVIDVSAGWYHSLALMSNGHVYAWGSAHVHLGVKDKDDDQLTPSLVIGLKQAKIKTIAAGYNHSVAAGEADVDEFLENEISLTSDLSAEHLINVVNNSTIKSDRRRAAKKLSILCIKTEPEARKIFMKEQGILKLLQEFAASASLKWKEDFYKRISVNHIIWEPFDLIKEFPHCNLYRVIQKKKNVKKNKQIALKILNSNAMNVEDLQKDILVLSLIKESLKYVNEFRGFLLVTDENRPEVLKNRKDLPLHCLLFNLADLSLEDLLGSDTQVPQEDMFEILISIVKGMCELNSFEIPHYDLRPANVLLKKKTKGYDVKLSDYLLGHRYTAEARQKLGAQFYRAPQAELNLKSDVFSFGILLWECFTKKKPALIDYTHNGKTIVIPSLELTDVVPKSVHKLIIRCTDLEPAKRPDFSLILMELSKLVKRRK